MSNPSTALQQAGSASLRLASHQPGTSIECSVLQPTGDGVRDVRFLLGPPMTDLSRWYDTYDGNPEHTPDWYAIYLPEETEINTIFFVHGPVWPVGGWWKTLEAHYLDQTGTWQNIVNWTITPSYNFQDERGNRQPFDPFQISFPVMRTRGIRLFGEPGGSLGITTAAYFAVGITTPEQAAAYLQQLRRPTPQIFNLLPPNKLWDLVSSIRDVTQIAFDVQSKEGLGLDHFLDEQRFKQFHAHDSSVYDQTSLYQLLGTREGWDRFGAPIHAARRQAIETQQPVIQDHHGGMVWIIIPVVVNGITIGTIENRNLICRDCLDQAWHSAAPERLGIDPQQYEAALHHIPKLPARQLEAVVQLLCQIIDLSQQQVHQRIEVSDLRKTVDQLAVPVLPVWPGVLTVPLIGQIDEHRAQQIIATVLYWITQHRAHAVLVDITGVVAIDNNVAGYITRLAQATQLLGAVCFLCGVRPEVATTLVSSGAELVNVRTFANLQMALAVAIAGRAGTSHERLVAMR